VKRAWCLSVLALACAESTQPVRVGVMGRDAGQERDAAVDAGAGMVVSDAGSQQTADAAISDSDSGSKSPDDAGAPVCKPASGCHAARYLGEIAGDSSGQTPLTTTGTGPEWLSVHVKEDSNSLSGVKVHVKLTGQADADYDLFVYQPDSADAVACDTPTFMSTQPGFSAEELDASWSDTLASDDSRTLSIEVRHISDACSGWTLEITHPE
jgi:hypothetical protein